MSLHTPTTGVRHSNRNITKSRRARESDEIIPGIDTRAPEHFATLASPSDKYQPFEHQESFEPSSKKVRAHNQGMDATKSLLSAVGTAKSHLLTPQPSREPSTDAQSATPNTSSPSGSVSKRPSTRGRGRGVGRVTSAARKKRGGSTSTARKARSSAAIRTPKPATSTKRSPSPDEPSRIQDFLDTLSLQIYAWPHPRPTDFTNLTKEQETWRSEQAYKEFLEDESADPDLEDWYAISGNAHAYSENNSHWAYGYSIARVFILRAKRARREDQTWEAFEDAEIAIDSMSQARAIEDPEVRKLHMEEAVNNDSRLRIFKLIRKRLCLEIWSQPFVLRWNLDLDEDGDVQITQVANKKQKTTHEHSTTIQDRDDSDEEMSGVGGSNHMKQA